MVLSVYVDLDVVVIIIIIIYKICNARVVTRKCESEARIVACSICMNLTSFTQTRVFALYLGNTTTVAAAYFNDPDSWYFQNCIANSLPFINITDDEVYMNWT